ncbi:MAG: DUF3842 family protein [Spirochaetales bacterium]
MFCVVVIDGMGGGIGAQLVEKIRKEFGNQVEIVALGINSSATERMMRAGADRAATGENAIRVSVNLGDCVLGPIGIVIPNALMGEVTPDIARAVFESRGYKVLIPIVQTHFTLVGVEPKPLGSLISEAVQELGKRMGKTRESSPPST